MVTLTCESSRFQTRSGTEVYSAHLHTNRQQGQPRRPAASPRHLDVWKPLGGSRLRSVPVRPGPVLRSELRFKHGELLRAT